MWGPTFPHTTCFATQWEISHSLCENSEADSMECGKHVCVFLIFHYLNKRQMQICPGTFAPPCLILHMHLNQSSPFPALEVLFAPR